MATTIQHLIDRASELYTGGKEVREIALDLGRTPQSVYGYLDRAGLRLRLRGEEVLCLCGCGRYFLRPECLMDTQGGGTRQCVARIKRELRSRSKSLQRQRLQPIARDGHNVAATSPG